ncbi:MAG: thiaminase II [Alphaproteobacteria bacterium]|nr:thiaminase II [Alphaproteobacteria bacterium]
MTDPILERIAPLDGLFARLRAAAWDDWRAYTRHAFVRALGDGTLPADSFRHYLVQDYVFLIHFARAYALAAYKSETLADMRSAQAVLAAILDVEMGLHVAYCAEWGIDAATLETAPEAEATIAYTRFVLDAGHAGDVLDLHVALAPCMLGYAEIGLGLAADPATRRDGNPYAPWIAMYSGDEFVAAAHAQAALIDRIAARRGGMARFDHLVALFRRASRLEVRFWDMGLARTT